MSDRDQGGEPTDVAINPQNPSVLVGHELPDDAVATLDHELDDEALPDGVAREDEVTGDEALDGASVDATSDRGQPDHSWERPGIDNEALPMGFDDQAATPITDEPAPIGNQAGDPGAAVTDSTDPAAQQPTNSR